MPQGAHGAELQEVLTVDLKAELADGAAWVPFSDLHNQATGGPHTVRSLLRHGL